MSGNNFHTREEAKAAAQDLKRRMKRGRWTAHICLNMNWHISIVNGPFKIFPRMGGKYSILCGPNEHSGMPQYSPMDARSEDPNELVEMCLEKIRDNLRYEIAFYRTAMEAAGMLPSRKSTIKKNRRSRSS